MGPNKGQVVHKNNIGPNKGQSDHRNTTLGPNNQPMPRSILKKDDKICPILHTGTYTGCHRGIAPKPKPPPACEANALNYSLSLPNVLSGHSAGSQMGGLSCYVSHWPGTPCCHQQNEWRQRTLSAPSPRPAASLSSARSPPMPHTAVASHCSTAARDVETRRSQVQGPQPSVTPRSVAGHQVKFSPIHEIIMPDGDSTFCNTTITYTTGHPERTNRTSLRSGSLTERTN